MLHVPTVRAIDLEVAMYVEHWLNNCMQDDGQKIKLLWFVHGCLTCTACCCELMPAAAGGELRRWQTEGQTLLLCFVGTLIAARCCELMQLQLDEQLEKVADRRSNSSSVLCVCFAASCCELMPAIAYMYAIAIGRAVVPF